jgi:hypothetical protein
LPPEIRRKKHKEQSFYSGGAEIAEFGMFLMKFFFLCILRVSAVQCPSPPLR